MIPKEEFRERLTKLQGLVAENSLDVFVVTAEERSPNVRRPDDTPMANLLLTLLDTAGVPMPERMATARSTSHSADGRSP